MAADSGLVVIGRVAGLFGVRGWVRVYSHTEPRAGIVGYANWHLRKHGEDRVFRLETGRAHGKGVIAKLADIDDRDQAAAWVGAEICVERAEFATPGPGEYYWADLVGLRVSTPDGVELGVVDHLIATGANDVLVVEGDRRRLIPFIRDDVVRRVSRDEGKIVVDWDPDF